MERRNELLTFLCALIPGVGYMYLGLTNMGVEMFLTFLLIKPLFKLVGLSSIGSIFKVVIWFYAFFNTFSLAHKLDRGEKILDKGFILSKFYKYNNDTVYGENEINQQNESGGIKIDKQKFSDKNIKIMAWVLIVFGSLITINKIFEGNHFYYVIKSSINAYFLPALLIGAGVYLLIKQKD